MKIIVLRHVPHEHLGTFADVLTEKGITYEYIDLFVGHIQPSLSAVNGLIILGGPMNVYQTDDYPYLDWEEILIKEAIQKEIPILGICLGAQLIAKALGARVYPNEKKEIGWYPIHLTDVGISDPLLEDYNFSETVFQWHGDTFEIPDRAEQLFSSPLCRNQAFRYGNRVYGLQFHLEVNEPMITDWLGVPDNVKELASLQGVIDPLSIQNETPGRLERLQKLSQSFLNGFVNLIIKEK